MTTTIPMISALYGAILGLLGAALTVNVIVNRVRSGIDAGDGGVAKLAQAIRAHANFAEQAPLGLVLIGFAEMLTVRALAVHVLGAALVVTRLASGVGLNRSLGLSSLRQLGAGLGIVVLVAASVAIFLAIAGIR
jgi:uncharacterized membrane protein YecN with MAPEG domain